MYVSVEPFHLLRYVDERLCAHNGRDLTDVGRLAMLLGNGAGNRLAYAGLATRR
jgi:hypothetical protein